MREWCRRVEGAATQRAAPRLNMRCSTATQRQLALDWLAQNPKGMLWFWLLVFLCTWPGLCFFSFTQLGLRFHPVGASFRFFLPSSLAVHLPPFTTQRSGFIAVPPGSQIWDSNRSPFGFVLTNPTPVDAQRGTKERGTPWWLAGLACTARPRRRQVSRARRLVSTGMQPAGMQPAQLLASERRRSRPYAGMG